MSKIIKYKGVTVNKPDNISMKFTKKLIDNLGGDYSFSIDQVINFLSKNPPTLHSQYDNDHKVKLSIHIDRHLDETTKLLLDRQS